MVDGTFSVLNVDRVTLFIVQGQTLQLVIDKHRVGPLRVGSQASATNLTLLSPPPAPLAPHPTLTFRHSPLGLASAGRG